MSLKQRNGMKHWSKGPEKEQPVSQLRTSVHKCSGNKGRRNAHTPRSSPAKQSSACESLLTAHTLLIKRTAATQCVLWGREKFQQLGSQGSGGWMGTSALWRRSKSNLLIAWGKHLGCTPQTTSDAVSRERLRELMKKEAEWMQSELPAREEWRGLGDSDVASLGRPVTWRLCYARTRARCFHPPSSLKWLMRSRPLGKPSSMLQSSECKTSSGRQLPWEGKNKASKGLTF